MCSIIPGIRKEKKKLKDSRRCIMGSRQPLTTSNNVVIVRIWVSAAYQNVATAAAAAALHHAK